MVAYLIAIQKVVAGSSPVFCTNFKLRDGLEMVPAWSHKPNYVSSNLTPATNKQHCGVVQR